MAKKIDPAILQFAEGYKAALKERAKKPKRLDNASGLNDIMFGSLFGNGSQSTELSQYTTLGNSAGYSLITRNWVMLSYLYATNGIIQTIIDVPVEDALRGGLTFKSKQLSSEELEELDKYMTRRKYYQAIKQARKWARLFGGSGVIVNLDDNAENPLNIAAIKESQKLKLLAIDRWELVPSGDMYTYVQSSEDYFAQSIKGIKVHKSRVYRMGGKETTSLVRRQLQGWGISSIEHLVRNLNNYSKYQEAIYELIDEVKTDILKITGYNKSLLSKTKAGAVNQAINLVSNMKNYKGVIAMDMQDDYEQKQISFSGLPELDKQNMVHVASDAKMPMTKLYGLSAAGFNAGEDDIENYNAMVEGEERAAIDESLEMIMPIICMVKFGTVIDDLSWSFKPLRVMSAEQEENIKTQKQMRIDAQFNKGLYTGIEYAKALRQEGLIVIETEVEKGTRELEPPDNFNQDILPDKTK
jgi:hypothetical protein